MWVLSSVVKLRVVASCRQAMVFKKKQAAVDEQIAEIDKLNAVINAAERDMLKLRKVCSLLTPWRLG